MKVKELVANMHNDGFNLQDVLQVNKYLPMEVKRTIAQSVIFECANEVDGITQFDSVQKYLAYIRHMITLHTCLEYTDADYDVLCATEYADGTLIGAIFECFERDADECEMVLELMMDDVMRELSIDASVAKIANKIDELANKFADKIDGVDLASIMPKGLDVERINGFLNKYMK